MRRAHAARTPVHMRSAPRWKTRSSGCVRSRPSTASTPVPRPSGCICCVIPATTRCRQLPRSGGSCPPRFCHPATAQAAPLKLHQVRGTATQRTLAGRHHPLVMHPKAGDPQLPGDPALRAALGPHRCDHQPGRRRRRRFCGCLCCVVFRDPNALPPASPLPGHSRAHTLLIDDRAFCCTGPPCARSTS